MNSDEQQIRELVATWMQATRDGDRDAVLALMTDDVVFLLAGRDPMIGKQAFAANLPTGDGAPIIDGRSEIREVQVFGDVAFMWSELTVEMTPAAGTTPQKRHGHTLSVLRRENGRWLLARDANLLVPVAAAST